jgi:hypothetical protein
LVPMSPYTTPSAPSVAAERERELFIFCLPAPAILPQVAGVGSD